MSERATITLKPGVSISWDGKLASSAFLRLAGDEYRQLGHLCDRRLSLPLLVEHALAQVDPAVLDGHESARADLLALRELTTSDTELNDLYSTAIEAATALSCSRTNLLNQQQIELGDLPAVWPAEVFWVIEKAKRALVVCLPSGPGLVQEELVGRTRALLPASHEYLACQLRLKGRRWPRTERPLEPLRDYLDERCVVFVLVGQGDWLDVAERIAAESDALCGWHPDTTYLDERLKRKSRSKKAQEEKVEEIKSDSFRCPRTHRRHELGSRSRRPIHLTAPLILELGRKLPFTRQEGTLRFDISGDAALVLLNPLLATTSPVTAVPYRLLRPYRSVTI